MEQPSETVAEAGKKMIAATDAELLAREELAATGSCNHDDMKVWIKALDDSHAAQDNFAKCLSATKASSNS